MSKRIAIITDAWFPQINGVVTAVSETAKRLEKKGHTVLVIHPQLFLSVPMPYYPDVKMAIDTPRVLPSLLKEFAPQHIHIATEGPIGVSARTYCLLHHLSFTTSYHTNWPECLSEWVVPGLLPVGYKYLRWFHSRSSAVMVTTESMRKHLEKKKFHRVVVCPLGVDVDLFTPEAREEHIDEMKRPIFGYLGRLGVEKNVEDFFTLNLPGTKLVIGDGPMRADLEKKYTKNVHFVGYQRGKELARYLASCDVLIMPSLVDTFGIVIIEAWASGVPVAAYDVTVPREIIQQGVNGYIGDNLEKSALACLSLSREACRTSAMNYSWDASIDLFLKALVPLKTPHKRKSNTRAEQ